ncbi:hypothetical protein RZR97_05200 [Hydrogenimonas thermophila]|uniref:hypothetical protein n=1 Tax=Hydrogenimonas thermophila TaxID=223786 RepID=UPI002936F49C|nr:hypothetical protein [Hydrogenimonas thermophila]WOE70971.1 hypothetical protein RZR91_05220 [Hydrogenimonas thermophila]WOE73489.1 hypothetical protein RZR97_05200 [Hydrogenimonas thermophila]
MRWVYSASITAILFFSGCGGGGSTSTDATYTGIFVDSPVDGLEYKGTLGSQGKTENGGLFSFRSGEVVTFSVGNVIIGETEVSPDDPIVTPKKIVEYKVKEPVDLNDSRVISIAQFLLAADIDNNASNNIVIDPNTISELEQKPSIRLDEEDINETIIAEYLQEDENTILTPEEVQEHLSESEQEIENGDYDDIDHTDEMDNTDETITAVTQTSPEGYRLLAWNDLGMHCMDGNDYSVFSILPPYNNLVAQLIKKDGTPQHITSGVTLTYEAVPSLDGKWNTTSVTKTNFWDYVLSLFGVTLEADKGLAGSYVQSKTPQPLHYDSTHKWWTAEGIPVSPKNDDGSYNMYPMVKVVAKDNSGNVLAETTTVLPVSDEMDCKKCHSSTSNYDDAKPSSGWVNLSDPEKDYKYNILRLHDQKHPTAVAEHNSSLSAKGWNYKAEGLEATANSGTPILCASCHKSNALPGTGVDDIKPLTQALHSKHTDVTDPDTGLTLNNSTNRNACYTCHPGATTQCLRGAMGNAKNPDGTSKMQCQSCHGVMSAVGSSSREGWFDEPNCQSCHQNGERYTEAVTDMLTGTLRASLDNRFATNPDTPMTGKSLYRYSTGHGNMQCSACHGSTHAIYPSAKAEDNIQSIQAQGHAGTIGECTACHTTVPFTSNKGPHGMHTVGQAWVDGHGDIAEDGGASSCTACHGSDYKGAPLSKTMSARTFTTEWGTKTFAAGHMVSCFDCHDGPNGD